LGSFSLEDLQRQTLITSVALQAAGINSHTTDRLMKLTDGLLEEEDFDELLTPVRGALAEIHELLQRKELPPWIKPEAVRREVRKLGRMLRSRNFRRMEVEFDCVVRFKIPFRDVPMVGREIERSIDRIDDALNQSRRRALPKNKKSSGASRKVASKQLPRKRIHPMSSLV
jgi:hypothetical protein